MLGIIFAICVSVGLPVMALIYACKKRRYIPFLLGVFAFVISQVFMRIPLLQYLQEHSTAYLMFGVEHPLLFAIFIGFSAAVFEEMARFIFMRFWMKQRDWQSGFLFGAGHGGIEAVLFVGISAITMLFSPIVIAYQTEFLIGGIERFFAMMLHIGLSIIVLQAVVQRKFSFVLLAILIHTSIDALIGIVPLLVKPDYVLLILEISIALTALAVFGYSLLVKRSGVLK